MDAKAGNVIINVLIVLLCVCVGVGIYMHKNIMKVEYHQISQPLTNRIRRVKVSSGGDDVLLKLVDHKKENIKVIGYFSKKLLDNNQYLTTSNEETMLNFNDTNSHYYSRNQHVIEVEIPIGQLDNIEVNTDGGDVQIDKNSVRNFDSHFYTNGGENRYSQISKNNKLVLTINSNGGNIS